MEKIVQSSEFGTMNETKLIFIIGMIVMDPQQRSRRMRRKKKT
jgi:hypothetical protein